MYIDKFLKFSDAQALTATADSTDAVDLSEDRDIGIGEPMAVMVSVGVAADFTSANETYQFQVETDDNDSFSSATVIADRTIVAGDLTVGSIHVLPLPHVNEQYLQVRYVLGGTTPSITVDAQLMPMSQIDGYRKYANAYDIT